MNGAGRHPLAVTVIKSVHSAIFLVELSSIGWLLITGLVGRRDRTVALAAGAVAIEAAVFIGNGRVCPLTPLTERLGATRGEVSDIFLPSSVARTIPVWASALVGLAALLHARSAVRDRSPRRRLPGAADPEAPSRPERWRTT
jgi:hypothetical protein